jgi:hypothetical protein
LRALTIFLVVFPSSEPSASTKPLQQRSGRLASQSDIEDSPLLETATCLDQDSVDLSGNSEPPNEDLDPVDEPADPWISKIFQDAGFKFKSLVQPQTDSTSGGNQTSTTKKSALAGHLFTNTLTEKTKVDDKAQSFKKGSQRPPQNQRPDCLTQHLISEKLAAFAKIDAITQEYNF